MGLFLPPQPIAISRFEEVQRRLELVGDMRKQLNQRAALYVRVTGGNLELLREVQAKLMVEELQLMVERDVLEQREKDGSDS